MVLCNKDLAAYSHFANGDDSSASLLRYPQLRPLLADAHDPVISQNRAFSEPNQQKIIFPILLYHLLVLAVVLATDVVVVDAALALEPMLQGMVAEILAVLQPEECFDWLLQFVFAAVQLIGMELDLHRVQLIEMELDLHLEPFADLDGHVAAVLNYFAALLLQALACCLMMALMSNPALGSE